MAEIRKISKSSKSMRLTIPPEIGWNIGDNIIFEKKDEDTVVLKRIKIFEFSISDKELEEMDKKFDRWVENARKKNDGGLEYYRLTVCETCDLNCNECPYFEAIIDWEKLSEIDLHNARLEAIRKCKSERGYTNKNISKDEIYTNHEKGRN